MTDFISLSGKINFPHTYVLAFDKQVAKDEALLAPSHFTLTRLQRARLGVQEAVLPYFNGERSLIGQTVRELKGENIAPENKMIDALLILMTKKAIRIALKKILRNIEEERLYEYLQECRKKLKDSFQQFYLEVREEKEELKRLQIKDQN